MGKLDFLFCSSSLPVAMEDGQMRGALPYMLSPAPHSQAGELFSCPSQARCHQSLSGEEKN